MLSDKGGHLLLGKSVDGFWEIKLVGLAPVLNQLVGPEALLPDAEAHPHLLYLVGADALKDRYVLHRGPPFPLPPCGDPAARR